LRNWPDEVSQGRKKTVRSGRRRRDTKKFMEVKSGDESTEPEETIREKLE